MGTVDIGFQEGDTRGREEATEGEKKSTWEEKWDGGKAQKGWGSRWWGLRLGH